MIAVMVSSSRGCYGSCSQSSRPKPQRVNLSTRCSASARAVAHPNRRELLIDSTALLTGAALLPSCAISPQLRLALVHHTS